MGYGTWETQAQGCPTVWPRKNCEAQPRAGQEIAWSGILQRVGIPSSDASFGGGKSEELVAIHPSGLLTVSPDHNHN
ncbi:hypothetical protein DPEC_G00307040 [Dallia pectoralis]|uniref:Uncharacterized protein n=1 Tax=Dallia pectoralis TaxID=75939 RepID=A0ACC2FE69_DALPE|nr:hypothetical protein DPEC_G00307040 [Dallia pectoralis]